MSVRGALLGLLGERPRHGYDLKVRYDDVISPERPVQAAQVYSTLSRLERDGRVVLAGLDQQGGPERRTYALTAEGRAELDRWLATPEPAEPHLQTALWTKVVLALVAGRSVPDLLDRQRTTHLARMRELTATRRTGDVAVALLADYALFHLEADLRWLELTAARIDQVRARLTPTTPTTSGGTR
jgi:DNA-binding PadR family transcriptional regulator